MFDTMIFCTVRSSIETLAALVGGTIIAPASMTSVPSVVVTAARLAPRTSLVRQSCCP
ncbi:MAG: hypothetical protein IJ736_05690 [Firmicutes bacterium]|nr:hypothetical protein [Bacillota bacterium]